MIGAMHIRAYLMTVTRPDGRKLVYYYKGAESAEVCGHTCFYWYMIRVQAIVSSDGYMLKASYASPAYGTSFLTLKSVQAINQSVDYCDPNADTCTGLTQDRSEEHTSELQSLMRISFAAFCL